MCIKLGDNCEHFGFIFWQLDDKHPAFLRLFIQSSFEEVQVLIENGFVDSKVHRRLSAHFDGEDVRSTAKKCQSRVMHIFPRTSVLTVLAPLAAVSRSDGGIPKWVMRLRTR